MGSCKLSGDRIIICKLQILRGLKMEELIRNRFDRWVNGTGIEGTELEGLWKAFKEGWERAERSGIMIYGAFNSHEYGLLLDDLSYWFGKEETNGNSKRRCMYLGIENFCRSYVLLNLIVGRARLKRNKAVFLRSRERVIKKYKKRGRRFLYGAIYFKFLCKHFGVIDRKRIRIHLIEVVAVNRWWPLCAWDIAMSRRLVYRPSEWNLERVDMYVPEEWREKMEAYLVRYLQLKGN